MMRSESRSHFHSVLGLRAAALLAAVVSGAGCAQSIGDIDRTQPDLIAKEHFQNGQWFLRETVVDVPPTSPAAFIGESGDLEVVVWDIQQNWLVGYRAYEKFPGLDEQAESDLARPGYQPVTAGEGEGIDPDLYKGNPVVAYRIEAHVDVQRGYNARTGEQNNIISENTTDRPWRERDYMRVDWSSNEVDSFSTEPRAFWPMFGQDSTMSSFVPANEGGADAFRMETDEEGNANYIDFTVRLTVTPNIMGCTAMFRSGIGDCTGEELKIRTSLMKVDVEREQDYVPLVYDDRRQGEFGYFRVERPSYDRRLGSTFTGLIQLAGRHEIWENSRYASGEPRPYRERELRPIRYTLSEHYPEEMRAVTVEIAEEYDRAFKEVAAAARGQTIAELEQDIPTSPDFEDPKCLFCIDPNYDSSARNGDLRYNFIYWVDERQAAGPLGYGPSSLHPETGRIVSANAYVYGASVDSYAEYAKQIVELMIPEDQGGLSDEDLMTGRYFREAVRGNLNPIDPRKSARIDGLSGEDLALEVLGPEGLARFREVEALGVDALAPGVPGLDRSRLAKIVGTELEARMIPEEWTRMDNAGAPSYLKARAHAHAERAAALGEPPPEQGPLGHLSVTNWFGGDALAEMRELEDLAARKSLWLADFDDPAIGGLAREVIEEGWQGDELWQKLRERVYKAVMLHEIGHTVGLRHNFAGSADALNFHDEYWEHRVKSIEPVKEYTLSPAPASSAFQRSNCSVQGPLVNAETGQAVPGTDTSAACAEQRAAGMAELQYSSIMDYAGRFNADFHGLGKYDVAAIASAYGDLVEVFGDNALAGMAQAAATFGVDVREAALDANQVRSPILNQGLDNALVLQGGAGMVLSHYTSFPDLLGGYQNLGDRRFMPRSEYFALLESSNSLPAAERTTLPVKVPYLSCYDEYVDSVDVCHRWDQGADNYEIVENTLTAYREYYVFNNFARDRMGFDPFNVAVRTASRYFLPLNNMYQHWLWGAAVTGYTQLGTPRGDLGAIAAQEGLEKLISVMSTPDYGAHMYDEATGVYQPVGDRCPDGVGDVLIPNDSGVPVAGGPGFMSMPGCVDVPRGVGRSFFSRYESSTYDIYRRVLESGHYYDQLAAIAALTQANASVVGIGRDVNADARQFRIPYNLVFGERVENLFSSIYEEDDISYGMHIQRADGRPAEVIEHTLFSGLDAEQLAALPVIAPGRSQTTRVQALVAGMNLLDGTLNSTFAKQGQISLSGSGEQRVAPAGFDLVEAADPFSGRVFIAYRRSDGTGGPWYAADMLDRANAIVAEDPEDEGRIRAVFGDIELIRLAFKVFENE